jgi:hypothetical protein
MITKNQKVNIISILGNHYSNKIIPHLERKGLKPLRAEKFTKTIIQKIINGKVEDLVTEIEILKLVKTAKTKLEKLQIKQKSIL